LVDLLKRHQVSLNQCRFLCLDEADRMLDMGFEIQIREVVMGFDMPRTGDRLTMMFSATFPTAIQRLADSFLHDYVFLTVGRVGSTTDNITQSVEYVEQHDKRPVLERLLARIPGLTLVFVETRRSADMLERHLRSRGIPATSIHGDRNQQEREQALYQFRTGECPILVATDVAARGLDIPNVKHVINYDMPNDIDSYVHRIGRTGRAGNTGTATAFMNERSSGLVKDLYQLLSESGQKIPSWFEAFANSARASRSGAGDKFGGRDYRKRGGGGRHDGGNSHRGGQSHTQTSYNRFQGGPRSSRSGGGGGGRGGGSKDAW